MTQAPESNERTRIERYDPVSIEPRWQARWEELGLHRTAFDESGRPPYYLLTMYPYPSGDLHIGHWYIVTPTDAIARFQRHARLQRLPADRLRRLRPAGRERRDQEQHPPARLDDVEHRQHARASCGRWARRFDWDAEVVTADPDYYRWNQWFFLQFLKAGLAYRAEVAGRLVPERRRRWRASRSRASTGTAGGAARRSRSATWTSGSCASRSTPTSCSTSRRSTGPEPVRIMQTNWIGRSEGAEVVFETAPSPHHAGGEPLTRVHHAPGHAVSA